MQLSEVNWTDLGSVQAYALELSRKSGRPQAVIKHPDRSNYNITFPSRLKEYGPEVEVVSLYFGVFERG